MRNPVDQYPKPPFRRQPQEWPGLAGLMDPRPDHGETSYQGSGRLLGRKALVTGGDSGIGRAAAIAFAREGADVAINYLPVEEPDAREVVELIRAAGRKAVALPGDIRDEAFCRTLVAEAVRQLGGLDILVNNAARQTSQPSIADVTTEQFAASFKTNVYAPSGSPRRPFRTCRRARRSSSPRRSRPTSRRTICSTTRRPRRATSPSRNRWPSSSPGRASG